MTAVAAEVTVGAAARSAPETLAATEAVGAVAGLAVAAAAALGWH